MMFLNERGELDPVSHAGIVLCFAFAAAAALISLFLAPKPIVISVAGMVVFIVFFALCGNQRLFFFWGLVLTAPLSLSKAFWMAPHMGGASAIMLDLDDIFIVGLLLFQIRDLKRGWRDHELRLSGVLFWWGGLIAIGVANMVLGPARHLATLEVIRMLKCYLLFFVLINEAVRARQIFHFYAALATGVAMESVIALIQFAFHANLGLQKLGEPELAVVQNATETVYLGHGDIFRAGGLMTHPNMLSGYLAVLLPMGIALLFTRLSPPIKLVIGALTGLGVAALLVTLSRSGWLAFAAAFILLWAVSLLNQRLRLRYLLARVAVIIAVVIGLVAASGPILKRIYDSDPGSVQFRYDMMNVAWQMIEDAPIFGQGTNTFVAVLPYFGDFGGPKGVTAKYGDTWPVVHDSWLITWAQQGTVGFLFLIGLYGYVLWIGVRTARYEVDDVVYALNLGACCGIVANMVDGIGNFFIDQDPTERVFWMVVALIVAINYWTTANRRQARALERVTSEPATREPHPTPQTT